MTTGRTLALVAFGLIMWKGCPMVREYQARIDSREEDERKENLARMIQQSNPLPPGAGPPPSPPASAAFDQPPSTPSVPASAAFDPVRTEASRFAEWEVKYGRACGQAQENLSTIGMVEKMPDRLELRRREQKEGSGNTKWVAMTPTEQAKARSDAEKFIAANCVRGRGTRP